MNFAPTLQSSPQGTAVAFATLVNWMTGRRKVCQGDRLYRENDHFHTIYMVHSGSFKSTLALADGCEQVNNFNMTGELLGLDGMADGKHASSATALEDSEIALLPYVLLRELSVQTAALHATVIRLVSREIVRGNSHMRLLGSRNATQRLAAFLLNQSDGLSARGYSATEFNLKMTRGDIGSFLGLTLETVSRAFTDLQQQRLLIVDRRNVRIADLEGLKRV